MPGRVRRLTARQVETLLVDHGFVLVSQRGSHRKWRDYDRRVSVVVPDHGNRPLSIGTLLSILRAAEIPDELWRE